MGWTFSIQANPFIENRCKNQDDFFKVLLKGAESYAFAGN